MQFLHLLLTLFHFWITSVTPDVYLHNPRTNQHSCQSLNNNCEIILQYMCDETIRDGLNTETIPLANEKCVNNNCETDLQYGMHENYLYYQKCSTQKRNYGLFNANQKLKGSSALFTRQNSDGTRFGYECPEERDYYPYWRPSPWKDIVVLTNNVSRCSYYKQQSENVQSRWSCELPQEVLLDIRDKGLAIPISKEDCEAFTYPPNNPTGKRGLWIQHPSHELSEVECQETEYTRDNHLGNTLDGHHFAYMWKLPNYENATCVLRIRYNISTLDFDGWNSDIINSKLNKNKIILSELNGEDNNVNDRGYNYQNNPQIKIFPGIDLKLQLAVNTAQYGRVFEDRSHKFGIVRKPKHVKENEEIHNFNIRGKRGNIVQVYPAVEYDFVPQMLTASRNDHIHIQWTGSNHNPLENDGEGLVGTDRNNVVPLADLLGNQPYGVVGNLGRSYPRSDYGSNEFLGLNRSDLQLLAFLQPVLSSGSLSKLDDSGTYFNLGLRQLTQIGHFNFMCTRNNNFSNRDQKGQIKVIDAHFKTKSIGRKGGRVTVGSSSIKVEEEVLPKLMKLRLEEWKLETVANNEKFQTLNSRLKTDLASNVLIVEPEDISVVKGKSVEVSLAMRENSGDSVHVYRTSLSDPSIWQRLDADLKNNLAIFNTERGGMFFARTHKTSSGLIAAIVVPLVFVFILLATVLYFAKNKQHWKAVKSIGQRTQRSLQNRI
uniref:Uncharacterized protein n=1 Tax=Strigamia maritima TaxID=126957 RepID=T1JAG2_STRMM